MSFQRLLALSLVSLTFACADDGNVAEPGPGLMGDASPAEEEGPGPEATTDVCEILQYDGTDGNVRWSWTLAGPGLPDRSELHVEGVLVGATDRDYNSEGQLTRMVYEWVEDGVLTKSSEKRFEYDGARKVREIEDEDGDDTWDVDDRWYFAADQEHPYAFDSRDPANPDVITYRGSFDNGPFGPLRKTWTNEEEDVFSIDTFEYDERGNLVREHGESRFLGGEPTISETLYGFDAADHRISEEWIYDGESQHRTTWTFAGNLVIERHEYDGGELSEHVHSTYDGAGRVVREEADGARGGTIGDGVIDEVTLYTYDEAGRVSRIETLDSSGAVVAHRTFGYDCETR